MVLVADDDPQVRELLARALMDAGYPVLLAANGRELVALYREHAARVGLVLLDVQMPELDGPATLADLRRFDPEVRCCFLSADTGGGSPEALLAKGAVAFVAKPFRVGELVELVHLLAKPVASAVAGAFAGLAPARPPS